MYIKYQDVLQDVNKKGCTLLTTQQEWEEVLDPISKKRIQIVSKCGHVGEYTYSLFRYQNNGVLCRECTRSKMSNLVFNSRKIEYDGFMIVQSLLDENFDVVRLIEGTQADFAIRPKNTHNDAWLGVQLKVIECAKSYRSDNYIFPIRKSYEGHALACVCVAEAKVWLFDADSINVKSCLCIGKSSKKHGHAQYNHENASRLYMTKPLHTLADLNIPLSVSQQKEHTYRVKRETHFHQTCFECPNYEGQVYDFVLHGKRVQEKVATRLNENVYLVCLNRKNRKGNLRYREGDNDIYWINIPDSSIIYIIPENELRQRGYIAGSDETILTGTSFQLLPTRSHWLNDYMFDYSKIDDTTLEYIVQHSAKSCDEWKTMQNTSNSAARSNSLGHKIVKLHNNVVIDSYPSVAIAAKMNNVAKSTLLKSLKIHNTYKGLQYQKDVITVNDNTLKISV